MKPTETRTCKSRTVRTLDRCSHWLSLSRIEFLEPPWLSPLNPDLSLLSVSAVQPHSFSLRSFIYWLVLGIVLCAVLYPAGVIILSSFETPGVKLVSGFGLQAWKIAFADPAIISAIWNTLRITLARQAIALPIAILLAWVIARTDVPGAMTLEFLFWLGYFLPPLPVTMGWILLMDPDYGVLNQWVAHLTIRN